MVKNIIQARAKKAAKVSRVVNLNATQPASGAMSMFSDIKSDGNELEQEIMEDEADLEAEEFTSYHSSGQNALKITDMQDHFIEIMNNE